jgi:hypothetical protein
VAPSEVRIVRAWFGYRSGDPERPAPGEPRAEFDLALTTLSGRLEAKARELGCSVGKLRQKRGELLRRGVAALVDGRAARSATGAGIDPRVREAITAEAWREDGSSNGSPFSRASRLATRARNCDRWGRLLVTRGSYRGSDGTTTCELELRVVMFPARDFGQRRLGSVRRDDSYGQPSAVVDLGEAVQTAVERGLPLLLSTEAAGHLADTVRVGWMKGRPGALTITSSDGLSATTRRVVAEQAISELRTLKQHGVKVTLDAGARQLVRMTLARPLADDPVLLSRQ